MTDEFNIEDYMLDGFAELPTSMDVQKYATMYYNSVKTKSKTRISPTSMGNCEKKMILNMLPHVEDWSAWGESYAKVGNLLEDYLTAAYGDNEKLKQVVHMYMKELVPQVFEEGFGIDKVVEEALTLVITNYMKANLGVAKLIKQNNAIKSDKMNTFSYADYFLDVNGEFTIGEVKSVGDMPFNVSPDKSDDNETRLEKILKSHYYQVFQLKFYTSILACDGQMIYVSRNSQKGNGIHSPKYFNAGNVEVPFDIDEAREILTRIWFTKMCIDRKIIPPTPDHMKPVGKRKTSSACGFCQHQKHCHQGQKLRLATLDYKETTQDEIDEILIIADKLARKHLTADALKYTRAKIYKDNKLTMPFQEYLDMFSFKGTDYED